MKKIGGYNHENNEEHRIAQEVLAFYSQRGGNYLLRTGVYQDGKDTRHYTKVSMKVPLPINLFRRLVYTPFSTSPEITVFAVETSIERNGNHLTERLNEGVVSLANRRFYFVEEKSAIPDEIKSKLLGMGLAPTRHAHYYQ